MRRLQRDTFTSTKWFPVPKDTSFLLYFGVVYDIETIIIVTKTTTDQYLGQYITFCNKRFNDTPELPNRRLLHKCARCYNIMVKTIF